MLKTKITSSLEKAFADTKIEDYPTLERLSALKGERVSVQYLYTYDNSFEAKMRSHRAIPKISGTLAEYANMRVVRHVPVLLATHPLGVDDNMLRTSPGVYPDALMPHNKDGSICVSPSVLSSAWIEINLPKDITPGEHTLKIELDCERFGAAECTVSLEVLDATLPDDEIYFTQWFHCDALAQYYEIPVWSEEHWHAIESFAKVAADNGINMLLTPLFTPPLDTAIGKERLTVQLVDILVNGGEYSFDFSRLDRWIDMCDRVGIKYLEIAHFFTQWGAKHAPKIMATRNGEYTRIFGWETDATGEEYKSFLRKFLKALLAHLKARGDDRRCYFHISDEPGLSQLDDYRAAKESIADILEGYPIMDALSNIDFYNTGVLEHPICASNHVEAFIDAGVSNLWIYYCVSQWNGVSNRYIAMPSARTRSIGMQMYKFNIAGFLHWGYNFYNNESSINPINPYITTDADLGLPAGDPHSVYPGEGGSCLESIRLKVFFEALQDIKAMRLCERYYSHEEVVRAMEDAFGGEIRFDECARCADTMLAVRERVNAMIKAKLS